MSARCDICGPHFIGRCPHGLAPPGPPLARLTEDELKLVAAQITPEAANDFARMLREHGQPEGPAWEASEQAVRVRRRPYPEAYGTDARHAPEGDAERLLLEVAQAGALLPTKASRWALEVLHVLNAERSAWRAREVELQDEINALRGNERAVIEAMPPSPVAFAGDVPTYVLSVLEWQRAQAVGQVFVVLCWGLNGDEMETDVDDVLTDEAAALVVVANDQAYQRRERSRGRRSGWGREVERWQRGADGKFTKDKEWPPHA